MKISVLTLGCKVNQAESSAIEGGIEKSGHKIVDISEKPDVCIINTCTVTSKSDYQSRQLIRKAHRAGARVLVTGCYSELNRESVRAMEGVAEVIDNDHKPDIVTKIIDKTYIVTKDGADNPHLLKGGEGGLPAERRSRLFIKIQDGCNYSCSYCAIQKARGISKSVEPETVVEMIDKAVESGYKEAVLTGIHLGAYGRDLEPNVTLSNLLITILKKTKICRIRLSSIGVREVDDDLLEVLSGRRVCNHLHIPLQSGDDNILKAMNRPYNSRQFSFKIEEICKKIPEIAIGTDIIVGFPGEGEAEFQNTYKLLEVLPISYMHIFPFSARPGTKALKMPDNTPFQLKKKRARVLDDLNGRKKVEYMTKQLGKTLNVLVEENYDGVCCGTSGNYLKIAMPQGACSRGTLVNARVEGFREGQLVGVPIISRK
ncbi:MAG: tRNA (N(6)-L-threonylcarbamoyladenosine(37)-C(2))-methylthiotransferase MtaB [Nitrospirae bacterium]|nr:MAG: tRNA (N(6)-L-threonylcarbamoyladenosine(37)-C(2))-methylthiotransferase MtaB [Nitrospirota bacterium]